MGVQRGGIPYLTESIHRHISAFPSVATRWHFLYGITKHMTKVHYAPEAAKIQ